jgi:hypothetical protein
MFLSLTTTSVWHVVPELHFICHVHSACTLCARPCMSHALTTTSLWHVVPELQVSKGWCCDLRGGGARDEETGDNDHLR